jgi:SAM-dependent methyltransferase
LEISSEFYDNLRAAPRSGLINISSNEYFENLAKDKKFDIIFIDASHHDEDVDKDISNALRHLSDDGALVMHDCNPPHYLCTIDTERVKVNLLPRPSALTQLKRVFDVDDPVLDLSHYASNDTLRDVLRVVPPEKMKIQLLDKETGDVIEEHDNPEFSAAAHQWCWDGMAYNGTVWRSFVKLRYNNPDFGMWVLDDDHGVGVITPAGGSSLRLPEGVSLDQALEWEIFVKHRSTLLNLVDPKHLRGQIFE